MFMQINHFADHFPPDITQPTAKGPADWSPDDQFGNQVHSVRFISKDLVPLATEHLANTLQSIADHPKDVTAWQKLLLCPRRLVEHRTAKRETRRARNEKLRQQITKH